MRIYPYLLMIAFVPTFLAAQQPCGAGIGSINRNTPKFGLNTNAHMPANFPNGSSGANWTQQWFIDSTATLNMEIFRFPGGTNANHWDWQTGWFVPAHQPTGPTMMIRTDEFKPGLTAANGKGLYVLNLETSNAHYEMDGLRHAVAIGLTPNLIALGNEHNLYNTQYPDQGMTSAAYAAIAKEYYDSIKLLFPASRICAVGGNTSASPNWHADILAQAPGLDAFAFHVYLTAANADLQFNVNRALAIPFGNATSNNTIAHRYNAAGFATLPSGKEVWVTEYNLEETQIASSPVISKTWTHLLYNTAMNHFFISKPNITMIVNHSLASANDYYECVSKNDRHITANGLAMKFWGDVAKGSSTCQDMIFSGVSSMNYSGATIPKLIGWKFNHASSTKGLICNFSKDTFRVSLAAVFPGNIEFNQYSADTAFIVTGIASLSKYSGNAADSITLYPFSITQVNAAAVLPVVLLDFTAKWVNKNVLLSWSTISETDTDVFEVQRSTDGRAFTNIANIAGRNTNIPESYSFTDINVTDQVRTNTSTIFYRLYVRKNNGNFFYSTIVNLVSSSTSKILISPNPAVNTLYLQNYDAAETHFLKLYDTKGATYKIRMAGNALDISLLPPGNYLLQVDTQVLQFIKHTR